MSKKRILISLALVLAVGLILFPIPAFAADGADVAGAATSAYTSYIQPQIKSIVNGVVFRVIDVILLVSVIVRLAMSIYSYRHNGNQFEWHLLLGLFCGLIVSLTAPLWIWNIIK